MATSDAQKRANSRWRAKNTHFFGVRMANREADPFMAACAAQGITPHSVFLAAAREVIAAWEAGGGASDTASSGAPADVRGVGAPDGSGGADVDGNQGGQTSGGSDSSGAGA